MTTMAVTRFILREIKRQVLARMEKKIQAEKDTRWQVMKKTHGVAMVFSNLLRDMLSIFDRLDDVGEHELANFTEKQDEYAKLKREILNIS
mmetsp:Transcript_6259/g.14163  ORF Transcript_6259/g.14163 Transcript_6259/m.14163 type:complete len:91 (+) Transcript_6259:167-439(+)